jgi:radical SAM protein with 4Fe4S-binding SPASM domain
MASAVVTSTYAAFSERLHSAVRRQRIPVDVSIELTLRCPLACAHCYNNLPMMDQEARHGELTTIEHHRLLDQLADTGSLWLLYTGGEIFARADFLDIYLYAKRKGFIVTLFTNGTLITERFADTLAEWRPFATEITLYGRTRETYERLTRVPGSYDRCLRGIRLLQERQLPLLVKTVATSINQHEIWEIKRFVEQELGLRFKFDALLTPRIDCGHSPLELRLTPEQIVALDLADPRRLAEWRLTADELIRPQQPAGHERDAYHCGGGLMSCAIDPLGRLGVCIMSRQRTFDLRHGTFAEGWRYLTEDVRSRQISRITKCTTCQLKSVCGMCPANGELENGNAESPVDFLCHVAHLRALTLGWPIPAHGECEFCPGGTERTGIEASAETLRVQAPDVGGRRRVKFLRVLADGAARDRSSGA